MLNGFTTYLLHLAITAASLGAASRIVPGVKLQSLGDLLVAALLLSLVSAVLKPVLLFLTLPITLLTLGMFMLVINAFLIQLVAALVRGFTVPGFWAAFFTGVIVSVLSIFLNAVLAPDTPSGVPVPSGSGTWI